MSKGPTFHGDAEVASVRLDPADGELRDLLENLHNQVKMSTLLRETEGENNAHLQATM